MKAIIIGLIVALLISIGFSVYFVKKHLNTATEEAAYWRQKSFKVDTVFSTTAYKDILQPIYNEGVPPAQVINYPTTVNNTRVVMDTAGMVAVLDSVLKTRLTISPTYITQSPSSHKLLYGEFAKDTLKLDILDITGKIRRETYPVNYSAFRYQYLNNSMRATELSTRNTEKSTQSKFKFYNGTYVNYRRDFLNKTDEASINIDFNISRFRLGVFAEKPLNRNILNENLGNSLRAGAKVGFRVF